MYLEERLRSHMHSGDELFVETRSDAGAITAAGRRRTRRNQVGGAAAGGVLALGLVFGIASQTGSNAPEDFAISSTDSAETEMAAMAPEGDLGVGADTGPSDEIGLAPDFVSYEVIVGVDDGFAGLRATERGITAIRSDDGIEWIESSTSGIPGGAEITGIIHDDGVFAAPFVVYDELSATTTSYIGTSSDLISWTVEALDFGDEFSDPFLGDLALTNSEVVAVVMVSPPFDEQSEELVELGDPSIFTIRGPIGGPYGAELLPGTGFGLSGLEAAGGVAMFTVSTEDGAQIWASNGGEWSMVRQSSSDEFPTLGAAGENVYLVDSGGVERSDDVGITWLDVGVPQSVDDSISSANVVSSEETIAVLFSLTLPDGHNDGYVLAAGAAGALEEASLAGLVPDRAFVNLVAVSDEEVLIEVFPDPEVFDEDLAASSGPVTEPFDLGPRYVRIPLA
jgi:hypothetical protein